MENAKPMYEQIYDSLREAVLSGEYKPGDRVPSEKELAEQFGVSRITTKKALEMLAADGWIFRQPGRGSFVTEAPSDQGRLTSGGRPAAAGRPVGGGRPVAGSRTLIGLVMTDFGDSYGTELVSGIERAATEQDCLVVLRRSLGDPEREEKAIQALLGAGVGGLIIFPAQNEHFSAEILKLVIDEFPLVLVDRYLKGVAATAVSTNNLKAARTGTDYLLDLGHSRIGLLTPPPIDTTAIEDRLEGFVQAHAERGVAVDQALWLTNITATLPNSFKQPDIERDTELIREHLLKNRQMTALVAIEYNIALLARVAAERAGLRVPEDLSILCFDNPPTPIGGYQFTHMLQAQELMGRTALEAVLKLKEGERPPAKILLDAQLVVGQSTGAPRKW